MAEEEENKGMSDAAKGEMYMYVDEHIKAVEGRIVAALNAALIRLSDDLTRNLAVLENVVEEEARVGRKVIIEWQR